MIIVNVEIRFSSGVVVEHTYQDSEVGYLYSLGNRNLFNWVYNKSMDAVKNIDDEIEDFSIRLLAD